MCFTKRYLLNPNMIELVDYFWGKHYVATIIDANLFQRQAELANIRTTPYVQITLMIDCSAVISTTFDVGNLDRVLGKIS